jgi:RNA polymerase sigma factor (sigma-70 family)
MQHEEYTAWVDDVSAAANDPAAFARLVRRFEGMAFARAWARLGDPWLAEDVAQEAMVEAYLHLGDLREPRAFPAWLGRIVAKHCDRATRRAALPVVDGSFLEQTAWQPPAETDDARSSDLLRAVDRLPAAQRQVVALAYLGGIDQAPSPHSSASRFRR